MQLTQLNSVQPISTKQVSRVFVPSVALTLWCVIYQPATSISWMFSTAAAFLHGRWRLWSICHLNRHVYFHNSINFSSNSSLQNSISRQTRQNTSYMTSWSTNWVKWVTTFRTDRWQLFTLWTCGQLDVELSWVELRRRRYRLFADATQLNSTSSWVEFK